MTGAVTATVRVWIGPADVPPEEEARCLAMLGAGERASAATLLHPPDRRRFTVAHGALRLLAAREIGVPPTALTWTTSRYGKPELTPPWSRWHTSLSHSGGLIAIALSAGRPVGVDVQQVVPGLDVTGMSARFFPPSEAEYVAAGGDAGARADRFARLWVRKEAVVKAAGARLWPNLATAVHRRGLVHCADPAGRYRVAAVTAPDSYRAAVALAGAAPYALDVRDWRAEASAPAALAGLSRP
jgi:4'-phosphopantetheinyl transferase